MAQLVDVRAAMREVLSSTPAGPIGLLQLAITWYKIRHAGGQAHYYCALGH